MEMTKRLCEEHKFVGLDVPALVSGEVERKTPIGLEIYEL